MSRAEIPRRKLEWGRAWRALQNLIDDPERTDQVFEIADALAGQSFERAYQRFCNHPGGQRLLRERPSLLAALSDRERLKALPAGTLGHRYAEFMECGNLTAEGLVEAEAMADEKRTQESMSDADRQLFSDRIRDMHDLWHVITGYGMDEAGEAANLAFTLAQIPTLGIGLIVFAAAVLGPKSLSFGWPRYLFHAWQRGRRTELLTVVHWEELLDQPLADVRRLLRVPAAAEAHPGGIIVANRDQEPYTVMA